MNAFAPRSPVLRGAPRSLVHGALGAAAAAAGLAAARCAGGSCARCFACALPGAGILLMALVSGGAAKRKRPKPLDPALVSKRSFT